MSPFVVNVESGTAPSTPACRESRAVLRIDPQVPAEPFTTGLVIAISGALPFVVLEARDDAGEGGATASRVAGYRRGAEGQFDLLVAGVVDADGEFGDPVLVADEVFA